MARNSNKGKGQGSPARNMRVKKNQLIAKDANKNRDLHFKQISK